MARLHHDCQSLLSDSDSNSRGELLPIQSRVLCPISYCRFLDKKLKNFWFVCLLNGTLRIVITKLRDHLAHGKAVTSLTANFSFYYYEHILLLFGVFGGVLNFSHEWKKKFYCNFQKRKRRRHYPAQDDPLVRLQIGFELTEWVTSNSESGVLPNKPSLCLKLEAENSSAIQSFW
jgi:hypothetical protein